MTRLEPVPASHDCTAAPGESQGPPTKRMRLGSEKWQDESTATPADQTVVRRHPLGIRPSGNALTSSTNSKRSCGHFARLSDELLLQLLEALQPAQLLRLGATCRALHAFTRSEELWRALFVESPPSAFQWRGTWRSTYLGQASTNEPNVDCSDVFSDALHRPFFCAHVPLLSYSQNIPTANEICRMENMSVSDFSHEWFDKPFILTAPVRSWPIYQTWSIDHLVAQHPEVKFRAEAVDWPLKTYADYMADNRDELPLYLFDRAFAEKMDLSPAAYHPPPCFHPDAFTTLGTQRPDHRWLIVGPARSGSTFHKDPNATSAWNAVLTGAKYWIMFPSARAGRTRPPPPGVFVSADQREVTTPLSIAEWLLGFHAAARATPGCREGVCAAGELLHVPGGWYHLVLNLAPSVALTHNFVPRPRVAAVLRFLRDQRASVSGFPAEVRDPYDLFVARLRAHDPALLREALDAMDRSTCKATWNGLVADGAIAPGEGEHAGFSFGFGGDGDEVP